MVIGIGAVRSLEKVFADLLNRVLNESAFGTAGLFERVILGNTLGLGVSRCFFPGFVHGASEVIFAEANDAGFAGVQAHANGRRMRNNFSNPLAGVMAEEF